MRTLVKGKDVTVYMEVDSEWVLIMCATSCTKSETSEEVNVTTADSDRENEYIGGSLDCSFTFDGAMTLDIPGRVQYEDLENEIGNVKRFLIVYETSFGDKKNYEADFLITSVDDSNGVNEYSTFSMTAKRSGAPTKTKVWADDVLLDSEDNPIWDSDGNVIRT
jgi:hypothetical protein